MEDDVVIRTQLFHNQVRECIICSLLFITLYILSYLVIDRFKKNTDFTADSKEDATVNRIALCMCTFTLAVSAGAVFLLPFSIISNEILLSFPENYYIQWLNGSLLHGLWNLVFLFSNISLVFLMPFAYFFTESEGFTGSKQGIMARVHETAVVLFLLTFLILGISWVAFAIINNDAASRESLYDLWDYYLPYLHSCVSLFGVMLFLSCTPFGLSRIFTITGHLLVKPRPLEDLDEQLNCTIFEEAALAHKLNGKLSTCWVFFSTESLKHQFLAIHARRLKLEMRRRTSAWQRNLCYLLAMLLLLVLTGISVLVVGFHILQLLIDETAMPKGMQDPPLGKVSLSMFGSLGAAMEVVLIFYLWVSSVVGFYNSPLFIKLTPRKQDTTMTKESPTLTCWDTLAGLTGWEIFTSSFSTTCFLRALLQFACSKSSPKQYKQNFSLHLVWRDSPFQSHEPATLSRWIQLTARDSCSVADGSWQMKPKWTEPF
ncbi:limb region 1 homolog-like protein isoform X3 [Mobula birostris]|uniref:limb region 1 homolog-like protein isoform X3 n=1 Tax=Mobula birostris TaxID=1983395 RepID=UPI003B27FD0A